MTEAHTKPIERAFSVPIEQVRAIARRRLELQTRLLEVREAWLKRSERTAHDALSGALLSRGVTILNTTVDEQEREKAMALCALTEKHAADVWEAIYQQSYPGRTPEPDEASDPADETSVGPERGSARPFSFTREAPPGGPVSEASERGAVEFTLTEHDYWGQKPEWLDERGWREMCARARELLDHGRSIEQAREALRDVVALAEEGLAEALAEGRERGTVALDPTAAPVHGWDIDPERGAVGVKVQALEDVVEAALYADQLTLALAERRRTDPEAPDAVVLGVLGLEQDDGTLALATEREPTTSPDGHPPAELVWRSRKGREPTTRPAPPPVHAESELDELLRESGISPPELVRRVTDRLGHAGLLDRVAAGDLLNDDQAITVVVVMAQELMASIAHLRPVDLKLHYLLELRGTRGA